MSFSPLMLQLIQAFQCLPGIGPKSAQRMVFHLLERNRTGGQTLANVLLQTMQVVKHCKQCRLFTETDLCHICSHPKRDPKQLCVAETPADVMAIEQSGEFKGYYFVLMGRLSPIDGIGPEEIGVELLKARLQQLPCQEVIMATSATVEGEATAFYLAELIKKQGIVVTRIAYGIPVGSELEYLDRGTLTRAFHSRHALNIEES